MTSKEEEELKAEEHYPDPDGDDIPSGTYPDPDDDGGEYNYDDDDGNLPGEGEDGLPSESKSASESSKGATAAETAEKEKGYESRFQKHRVTADTVDHYEALGLAHLRWEATDAQIRSAYRKMSLQYHPDKLAATAAATGQPVDDSVFKRICRAYEVLGDPQKRKEYDSQDTSFDARVPSEKDVAAGGFYEVLAPVFDRNARWSVVRPVPRLGDADTPYADVERFYAFWRAFRTWRELPLDDEYDPAEARTREEKRWILRQNA